MECKVGELHKTLVEKTVEGENGRHEEVVGKDETELMM